MKSKKFAKMIGRGTNTPHKIVVDPRAHYVYVNSPGCDVRYPGGLRNYAVMTAEELRAAGFVEFDID